MTTIAFDGKTIAVDRASWAGYIASECNKLFHIRLSEKAIERFYFEKDKNLTVDIVYCAAGNASEVPLILKWMESGEDLPIFEDKSFGRGIILFKGSGNAYRLTGLLTLEKYESYPVADGGGAEIALGAMLAGADAIKAVELVELRSNASKFGVSSYIL